jgi:hypothetical protein
MSSPIDMQTVLPTSGVVTAPRRATRRDQTRPNQIWEQLTPAQQQAVFQALVKVCLGLANPSPRSSTDESEVKHDRP